MLRLRAELAAFPGAFKRWKIELEMMKKIFRWLSSPRLTLGLLAYAVFLVFVGTLAQREIGIMQAQREYFESFFCLGRLGVLRFPLFGGAAVGVLALANIFFSALRFARGGMRGFGMTVTHMALALLIISGALQYFVRVEGRMSLYEGMPTNLVFVGADGAPSEAREVKLPFSVRLAEFKEEKWPGSDIPKSFSSRVYFERGQSKTPAVIEMNNPASFGGWTFYQMSFAEGGKVSILSAVKNHARLLPWISVGAAFAGMLTIFLPRVFRKSSEGGK